MFKKAKTEFVSVGEPFKDWKDSYADVEQMGARLDAARTTLACCKEGTWAHTFWSTQVDILMRKWKLMTKLLESGLRQKGAERNYDINYEWWEQSYEVPNPFPAFNMFFGGQPDLERSWANALEEKVQKARLGRA